MYWNREWSTSYEMYAEVLKCVLKCDSFYTSYRVWSTHVSFRLDNEIEFCACNISAKIADVFFLLTMWYTFGNVRLQTRTKANKERKNCATIFVHTSTESLWTQYTTQFPTMNLLAAIFIWADKQTAANTSIVFVVHVFLFLLKNHHYL